MDDFPYWWTHVLVAKDQIYSIRFDSTKQRKRQIHKRTRTSGKEETTGYGFHSKRAPVPTTNAVRTTRLDSIRFVSTALRSIISRYGRPWPWLVAYLRGGGGGETLSNDIDIDNNHNTVSSSPPLSPSAWSW